MRRILLFAGIGVAIVGILALVVMLFFPHVPSGLYLFYNPNSQVDFSRTNAVPEDHALSLPPEDYQYAQTIIVEDLEIGLPWELIEEKQLMNSTFVKSENQDVLITRADHIKDLSESIGEFAQIDQTAFTDYEALSMILRTRRDDVSLFGDSQDIMLSQILLILKLGIIPQADHQVYAVDTEEFKGYVFYVEGKDNQVSDTSKHHAILFHDDGSIYELFINNASNDEVDYILSSVTKSD